MVDDFPFPSPLAGEGGARPRSGWEGEGTGPTGKQLLARARWMRANPTNAEKKLWTLLRDRRFAAFKFRRQQVIGPYRVDFVCLEQRLIIEADGSQHSDDRHDARRTGFLVRNGFRVLRFWNTQVLSEALSVAEAIYAALPFPHPPAAGRRAPPSPARGEGLGAPDG